MSQDRRTVDALARELGATIYYNASDQSGSDGPRANPETRTIWTRPLDEPGSFWTVLHELGHIALKHEGRSDFERFWGIGEEAEAEQEAEAWKWAIEHAGRPLDEDGRVNAKFALTSYIRPATMYGPNLEFIVSQLGPDAPTVDGVERTFGPDYLMYVPQADFAWSTAVKNVDLANAA